MKHHQYKFEKEIEGFTFKAPSRRKGKKYDVFSESNKYLASFGSNVHQQFFDRIGFYSHLDHRDSDRMTRYFKRHGLVATPRTPKWFSHFYLWAS